MTQLNETTADLLSAYRVIETFSEEQFRRGSAERLGARCVSIRTAGPFSARTSIATLRSFQVRHGESSASLSMDFREDEPIRIYVKDTAGSGSITVATREHAISDRLSPIIPAGAAYQLQTDGHHDLIILRIQPAALRQRLDTMMDRLPSRAIDFPAVVSNDDPRLQVLQRLMHVLLHEIGRVDAGSVFAGELEELIISSVLRLTRSDPSSVAVPLSPSHAAVRIAAEYIDVHWQRAVSIDELTAVTGVSGRSLFRGFRDVHGCTPMIFARRRRLSKAREMLASPANTSSVHDIALKCGFANVRDFNTAYLLQFGELPAASQTKRH